MIKVSILDDHKVVAEGFSEIINKSNIATVIDLYTGINSCRSGLKKALPDVLLLDVELSDDDIDGLEFCAELRKSYPDLKIIMFTKYREFNVAKRALYNGANGYIIKVDGKEELIPSIETVYNGGEFLCEKIKTLLKGKSLEQVELISPQEREVLNYIADGLTTKEIAEKINLSVDGVRSRRRKLFIQFGVKNMAALVKKATEQNLL